MTSAAAWWRPEGALARFMADLLSAEARSLGVNQPASAWVSSARLDEDGLGLDSLDRVALAAALGEALHLHRGGSDNLLTYDTVDAWQSVATGALERFSASIGFRTSGSTGSPRAHIHSLDNLLAEAEFWAALLPGRARILTMVPSHHIYGFLFTQLLPSRLSLPVIDLRGQSPGALAGVAQPGDLIIGHPFSWDAAVRAAPEHWPTDLVGVTSGARCPDEVAQRIRSAGLSRLVDVYGSTETAGIGWRDDRRAAHRLLPYWRRSGDRLSRDGAAAIDAPDHLWWNDEASFEVGNRRDTVVQVGGQNVSLDHVEATLLGHRGVSKVAVRLMRPREGFRLKAFIVPVDPGKPLEPLRFELVDLVKSQLAAAARPRSFCFGDALPVSASGKPADWLQPD